MPEHTIAENLQRLIDAKTAIGSAIAVKGGTVEANDGLEEFAADIISIKNDLTSIDITENGTYYSGSETVVTSSTFPIVVSDSDGTPVRHADINGNIVQSGTPTSDNPIIPNGVGVRTENLFDIASAVRYEYVITNVYEGTITNGTLSAYAGGYCYVIKASPNVTYTLKVHTSNDVPSLRAGFYSLPIPSQEDNIVHDGTQARGYTSNPTITITNSGNYPYIILQVSGAYVSYLTITVGSTAPASFIPYGYKIPISSGGVTTNIYLGSTQSVRQIKKLVLTGNENISNVTQLTVGYRFSINIPTGKLSSAQTSSICTHFVYKTDWNNLGFTFGNADNQLFIMADISGVNDTTTFANWLADQYANGTPVTIWYVLATAETAVVNEPLMKIGDYADSLSVDVELPLLQNIKNNIDVNTTLKPSSASFTYNKLSEYIGYNEINVDVPNTYTAGDEGKVVDNGALVAQTAMSSEITENGTVDTTLYNSVTVNVSGSSAPINDVNFYDYDGTIVKSYSASDFANLSALPENPSHTGLTAQGWNWTLADAKTYVADYGKLDIGQMYKSNTPNGDTLLHIRLSDGRLKPFLGLTGNSGGTAVDIDWGDGSAVESVTLNSSTVYTPHEYAAEGEYTIAISVTSGTISFNGDNSYYSNIFRKSATRNANNDKVYQNILFKAEIGTGVTSIGNNAFSYCYALSSITIPDEVTSIGSNAFAGCYSLSSITIPDEVTSIRSNAFQNCYSLTSITIPDGVTSIENGAFQNCTSLSSITIPDTVTSIGNNAFGNCYALSSITIPDEVTSIGNNAFSYCYALSSITIPDEVTSIGSNAFAGCYSLSSITIPDEVTSIRSNAFQYCSGLGFIRFTKTTPPTVPASSAFTNVPTDCIIYVPAEYIPQYKAATNYPNPNTYAYVGYGTYTSGDTLPTTTHDAAYTLTWYATLSDWQSETNPITVSTGAEAYARATLIPVSSAVTREVDFVNNTSTLDGDVSTLNVYSNMKRCNVADNGTINAYDGDVGYTENGSNGQVMVKVNKFYYKLDVSQTGDLDGVNIRKGRWSISDTPDTGFKLHPAFLAADGVTELDYFLYGAFDAVGQNSGGTYGTSYNTTSDKLSSVAGSSYLPTNSMTRATARTMATNRGTGWYSAGVKQTMAVQMLMAVEYGFNSQMAIGQGVVSASAATYAGQTTGNITSGTQDNKTTPVNWRGIENLWGNIYEWVDGLNFSGKMPYFCNSYTFVDGPSTGYTQISFSLPSSNYITAFGYDSTNDWVLLPSESSSTANPTGPIGDYIASSQSSQWCVTIIGGGHGHDSDAGVFDWCCYFGDAAAYEYIGARLMFIPTGAV